MIERQVIVTWYKPEEKLPPEDESVVVTASGTDENKIYDHALLIANYADDGCGWIFDDFSENAEMTVHAWADLDPFGGDKGWKDK